MAAVARSEDRSTPHLPSQPIFQGSRVGPPHPPASMQIYSRLVSNPSSARVSLPQSAGIHPLPFIFSDTTLVHQGLLKVTAPCCLPTPHHLVRSHTPQALPSSTPGGQPHSGWGGPHRPVCTPYNEASGQLLADAQSLGRPHGLWPTRILCPWDSPGKNTGVGCHSLLQGIFLTQGSNLGLLHCRQILPSEPPGKPALKLCTHPKPNQLR